MFRVWIFASGAYRRYRKSEIPTRAAALAYYTLLSVVPIVTLVFWYLEHIGVSNRWVNLAKHYLLSQLDFSPNSVLMKYFDRFVAAPKGHSWGWIGLILLSYTFLGLIQKFGWSLDAVIDTGHEHPNVLKRGFLQSTAWHLIVILTLPLALLSSLVVTQWIRRDSWLHYLTVLPTVGPLIALPISWAVDIVALFLVYYFIPRSYVPVSQALRAALVAGPAIEISRYLFGLYAGYAVSLHKIYGIFVVVPLFILWVHLLWLIILCAGLLIRFKPIRLHLSDLGL